MGPRLDWASVSEAVEGGGATFAAMVMSILGLRGRERERAEEVIGKGGEAADRAMVFLIATQIRGEMSQMMEERKWRWVNFGLALLALFLAALSLYR